LLIKKKPVNNGIDLIAPEDLKPANAVILSVPHKQSIDEGGELIERLLSHSSGTVYKANSWLINHSL